MPLSPPKVAAVVAELQRAQFVEENESGLHLTPLGTVVAESGLAVRSAVAVARVFRGLQPQQLNRATIIATAQLTAELDDMRLTINHKGVQREIATFAGGLARQGAAQTALLALRNTPAEVSAARAKKAVACLLWMNGTPSAQLERIVMQH